MKKTIAALIACFVMIAGMLPAFAEQMNAGEDIVILYENDAHCAVEGYSKLAALKKELALTHDYVGVVSSGDYIQGSSLGVVSKGEYIVNLMNLVGYDAVTLGNHEFDYRLSRLEELIGIMHAAPVCCNFRRVDADAAYFDPYTIVSYGETDIAYIGITTPATLLSAAPAQFKDEQGNFLFTFESAQLYDVVQKAIDSAKAEGADYIIALSHIGDRETDYDIAVLVENTAGLDAVLDAHSHSVIEGEILLDAAGNEVVLTSTGTKFEHIGMLTISDGTITTELIKTEEYPNTDPEVDAYLEKINNEYSELGNRVVGISEVDLLAYDADGNRLVRNAETNLGDLCADAFRYVAEADVAYSNGGGIRATIHAGEVTFNDLLNVFPFNNQPILASVSGQVLKDMMEMAMESWPEENGSFPHLAGMKFAVNTAIPSSIVLDDNGEFCGVSGEYRVHNMQILNRETDEYEPIDLEKQYTFAAPNYFLLEYGSGMKMLEKAEILQNTGMLDVEAFERYIEEALGGVIGEEYAQVNENITFTEGWVEEPVSNRDLWILAGTAVGVLVLAIIVVYAIKKKASGNK